MVYTIQFEAFTNVHVVALVRKHIFGKANHIKYDAKFMMIFVTYFRTEIGH